MVEVEVVVESLVVVLSPGVDKDAPFVVLNELCTETVLTASCDLVEL